MQNSPASSDAGEVEQAEGAEQPERSPVEAELAAALADTEDRYKRALADLDNYRKRSVREIEQRTEQSRQALLREWLDVVDSVERALRIESSGPLYDGLRAVLDQIEAVLVRQGVQRIGEPGERFDPERHEAVGVRASDDAEDQTVLEVTRSGFAQNGRVLRPAEVVVARRAPPEP